MKVLSFVCLSISIWSLKVVAQQPSGIQFQNARNWNELLATAKSENKYIFVDFYATWCGPCKQMDKDVYVLESVGAITNESFISVKIQVDTTDRDSDTIKHWYPDAERLTEAYQITKLPTLVCLTPDGSLISKDEGYQSTAQLIAIFNRALRTKSGYQIWVEQYRKHQLPVDSLVPLARMTRQIGNYALADSMAADYRLLYLDELADSLLLTRANLEFAREFSSILNSNDRIFRFFYAHPEKADQILGLGTSQPGVVIVSTRDMVKYIITKEEINDKLYSNGKPIVKNADWDMLYDTIRTKYNKSYADELVSAAKIPFYQAAKNWIAYAALIDSAIKKYPPHINGAQFANATMIGMVFQRDDWNLNSGAWDIFLQCTDKKVLQTALRWSNLSIAIIDPKDPSVLHQYLDTKANLLYRLGRVKEAIKVETDAYNLVVEQQRKAGRSGGGEGYLETIQKMKSGQPTWAVPPATASSTFDNH